MRMKKIGLVGGVGWPATAAYYSALCSAAKGWFPGGSPNMMIESLNMAEVLAVRGVPGESRGWSKFDTYFVDALNRLKQGGCDIAAIASATPHARLSSIADRASIPIISILDATARALKKVDARNGFVLGTSVTMASGLFDASLRDRGLESLGPRDEEDISAFTGLLNEYFYSGKAADGRIPVLNYCRERLETSDDTVIILGCTDLAPAFPDAGAQVVFREEELMLLDTTMAHVRSILDAALI